MRKLPEDDERALSERHNLLLAQMLPVLGPLLGLAVILFGAWDYWIDASHAATTELLRIALVLAGTPAYRQTRLPWTPLQRFGYVYVTHTTAMIVSASLLRDGLILGLTGITASVFIASLIALRLSTFVLIMLVPSLLVLFLAASLPLHASINTIVLYLFSVVMATLVMLTISAIRRQAYVYEQQLLHSARYDSLSGAPNRGYLAELARSEVAVAKRHRRPLAAAMLDIDHFKRVNDTFGHAIGDLVIQRIVKTCMDNMRESDHFGRIGGEEFVLVMPETDAAEAIACAERMRASIEALRIDTPRGPLQVTISAGVAMLDWSNGDWKTLLEEADKAMYRAKMAGRNRSVLAVQARGDEMPS